MSRLGGGRTAKRAVQSVQAQVSLTEPHRSVGGPHLAKLDNVGVDKGLVVEHLPLHIDIDLRAAVRAVSRCSADGGARHRQRPNAFVSTQLKLTFCRILGRSKDVSLSFGVKRLEDQFRVESASAGMRCGAASRSHLGPTLHELDCNPLAGRDVLHELAYAERPAAHIADLQRSSGRRYRRLQSEDDRPSRAKPRRTRAVDAGQGGGGVRTEARQLIAYGRTQTPVSRQV